MDRAELWESKNGEIGPAVHALKRRIRDDRAPLLSSLSTMVPNPSDPESFTRKSCTANGIHIEYVDENEQSDNIILLIHGWPDLWLGKVPFCSTCLSYLIFF